MKKPLLTIFAAAYTLVACAQDSLPLVVIRMVHILAEPIPVTDLGVADSVYWRHNRANDIGRLLGASGSVYATAYGPPGTASLMRINGTAPDHSNLTRKGVPLQSISLGMTDCSMIPAFFFDGIGIDSESRVPRMAFNGIGSDFQLRRNAGTGHMEVTLLSEYNSLDNRFLGARWLLTSGKWTWETRALRQDFRNRFSYRDSYLIDNPVIRSRSNGEMKGVLSTIGYAGSRHNLELETWIVDRAIQLPNQMGIISPDLREQFDLQARAIFSHTYKIPNDRSVLLTTVAHVQDQQQYREESPSGFERVNSLMRGGQTHASSLFTHRLSTRWFAESGMHLQRLQVMLNNVHPAEVYAAGWNARLSYRHEKHEFSADTRREKRSDREAAQSVWASWRLIKPVKGLLDAVQLEGGRKIRIPDFNELYWSPGGNPDLRSESSANAKLTAYKSFLNRSLNVQILIYHFAVDDWIQWVPGESGNWSPVNYKSVNSSGAEFLLTYTAVVGRVKLHSQARYQWNRAVGTNRNELESPFIMVYSPEHRASGLLDVQFSKWSLMLSGRYNSQRFTDEANNLRYSLDPFAIADLGITRTIPIERAQVEASLRVDNLFNQSYELIRAYAIPGRVIHLSLLFNLKYNNRNASS